MGGRGRGTARRLAGQLAWNTLLSSRNNKSCFNKYNGKWEHTFKSYPLEDWRDSLTGNTTGYYSRYGSTHTFNPGIQEVEAGGSKFETS